MRRDKLKTAFGYSVFELVVVIVIIAIISTVALKSLRNTTEQARTERTKQELDQIAFAITGNPQMVSGGVRTDYGYVGDIGALPGSLDNLVSNPGGYATWDGPYIRDDFSADGSDTRFKADAWGKPYVYSGGNSIASVGSGITITRLLAGDTDDLLVNTVSVVITDLDGSPPGSAYRDSAKCLLTYPDGVGGLATRELFPRSDGFLRFDSIPIGLHALSAVFLTTSDTLVRPINVDVDRHCHVDIQHFADIW
ncbi:MAG: type II secretion system protein GspG [candidate division Zixibacteria bacterium]|nr:type II secretion system protein GspG [candidate division Zixibacteria bacterium]